MPSPFRPGGGFESWLQSAEGLGQEADTFQASVLPCANGEDELYTQEPSSGSSEIIQTVLACCDGRVLLPALGHCTCDVTPLWVCPRCGPYSSGITLPLYTIIYPDAIASLEAMVSSSTKWDNNGDHTALADLRHDAGLRRAYGQRWGPSLFTRRETEALIAELAAQTDRAKRGSQATSCALEVPTATVYSVSVTGGGQTGGGACGEHLPPLGRLPWDLVIYILLLAFAREQEAGPRLASTPAVPGQSP